METTDKSLELKQIQKISICSKSQGDRHAAVISREKLKRQGVTPLVLRMYEDREPIDKEFVARHKPKAIVAAPPPKAPKTPKIPKAPKPPKVAKVYGNAIKQKFLESLPLIFPSDRAIGVFAVFDRAVEIGLDGINRRLCQEYLHEFSRKGLVFKIVQHHKYTAYALQQTDLININECLPSSILSRCVVSEDCYKLIERG